jgi:NADPH:quinone reductase-like Zn-dependent oxidoreductase
VLVAFANITFVETQFRASGTGPFKAELPMVLGNGVGGVVTSVGAGVDGGLVGKRVVSGTAARAATPSLPPWMPGDWSRSRAFEEAVERHDVGDDELAHGCTPQDGVGPVTRGVIKSRGFSHSWAGGTAVAAQ